MNLESVNLGKVITAKYVDRFIYSLIESSAEIVQSKKFTMRLFSQLAWFKLKSAIFRQSTQAYGYGVNCHAWE